MSPSELICPFCGRPGASSTSRGCGHEYGQCHHCGYEWQYDTGSSEQPIAVTRPLRTYGDLAARNIELSASLAWINLEYTRVTTENKRLITMVNGINKGRFSDDEIRNATVLRAENQRLQDENDQLRLTIGTELSVALTAENKRLQDEVSMQEEQLLAAGEWEVLHADMVADNKRLLDDKMRLREALSTIGHGHPEAMSAIEGIARRALEGRVTLPSAPKKSAEPVLKEKPARCPGCGHYLHREDSVGPLRCLDCKYIAI